VTKIFTSDSSGLEEDDVQGLALARDGTLCIAAGGLVFQHREA